ncbi:MAG: DUF4180 domain-containing protein [Eubacteriaceae bacterium]|nr:DUF4180 domain-containing protein [Eubacteriaceae bacterium]
MKRMESVMDIRIITINSAKIALANSGEVIISDSQTALDFAVGIGYGHDCHNIAINKEAINESFFDLTSGLAGEITQKLVNYRYRLAIIGDYSAYQSSSLKAFIFESNNGNCLFFVASEQEAIEKLAEL